MLEKNEFYSELLGLFVKIDRMDEMPFSVELGKVQPLQPPLGMIYHIPFRYKKMKNYKLTLRRLIDGKVVETHQQCNKVELLLSSIDKTYDGVEQEGGYGTFSLDGNCKPSDKWEAVMTIRHDGKVLCPVSAGGNWGLFDEHRKARRNVIMKYEKNEEK